VRVQLGVFLKEQNPDSRSAVKLGKDQHIRPTQEKDFSLTLLTSYSLTFIFSYCNDEILYRTFCHLCLDQRGDCTLHRKISFHSQAHTSLSIRLSARTPRVPLKLVLSHRLSLQPRSIIRLSIPLLSWSMLLQ
jgi:hypothetical protein